MVDFIEEIDTLLAQLQKIDAERIEVRHAYINLADKQKALCKKKLDPVLAKKSRYTWDGLEEELRENCQYSWIEQETERSYYDRQTNYILKCTKCGIHIPLNN